MEGAQQPKVSVFLAGCQKTASTWLYHCFREHPDIFVPELDAIHYFTINHYRGLDWYHPYFGEAGSGQTLIDATPSYIRDPEAARRIFAYNPEAKLIFSLRNPIDRAFSHYWHQKRKGQVGYAFEDAINYRGVGNIDMFDNWIRAGMYIELLQPFLELFPKENIKVVWFEDLKKDPNAFIKEVFSFIGVDEAFVPNTVSEKRNAAKASAKSSKGLKGRLKALVKGAPKPTEYELGMAPEVRQRLQEIYREPNRQLGEFFNKDLSHWT